jgi:hypothetical protein
VFLGQNIACQVSLTLTAARRAVIVEPDYTANVNYQLAKRIARIGQSADRVIVQFAMLAGSLDKRIVRRNIAETRMAERVFDAEGATRGDAGSGLSSMRSR